MSKLLQNSLESVFPSPLPSAPLDPKSVNNLNVKCVSKVTDQSSLFVMIPARFKDTWSKAVDLPRMLSEYGVLRLPLQRLVRAIQLLSIRLPLLEQGNLLYINIHNSSQQAP